MQSTACFTYQVENDLIIIKDGNGLTTVTADIERVIADIQTKIGTVEGKIIIWRDSEGIWDAVGWNKNEVEIHPLGSSTLEDTIGKLKVYPAKKDLRWSDQDNNQLQKQSSEGRLRKYDS